MEAKLFWLVICVVVYWSYCIFWGLRGAIKSHSAVDYFLAGRQIPYWFFLAALTVASFSAWTFLGHPGLLYSEGFTFGFAAFYAILVPFTGLLFFKRQWMLAKRFGFVTPGEMFSLYFQSNAIKFVITLTSIIITIPYLAIQLRASGFLLSHLTDNALPINMGIWLLAIFLFIYVALGGMRALIQVATVQSIFFLFAIITLSLIVVNVVGGYDMLNMGIAALSENDSRRTSEGYSHYLAILDIRQNSDNGDVAVSSEWVGLTMLSFMLALLGIQSTPNFSMLLFSSRSTRPLAVQQVWISSLLMGIILVIFIVFLGMGAHFLGADAALLSARPDLVNNEIGFALQANGIDDMMEARGAQFALVPYLINLTTDSAPWLVGIMAIGGLSVMQAAGAAFLFTTGGMIARDLHAETSGRASSTLWQINSARFYVLILLLISTALSLTSLDILLQFGSLALAAGLMMWPSLIAIGYVPWFTRSGIILGLVFGMVAVVFTESSGIRFAEWLDMRLPWGSWPLSLHSAFWGILINLTVVIMVSAITQNRNRFNHRMQFHHFLRLHCSVPIEKRRVIPLGWVLVLVWFFFGVGPGAVLGTSIFGDPNNANSWIFGFPSIWAWQILWIVAGVFMMWFLAYRVRLSASPDEDPEVLVDDIIYLNKKQALA